jgi:TP901 family phage tail tape measure protein
VAKSYEMMFKLNASMGGGFGGAFGGASKQIQSLQKEIQALNNRAGDIKAFQKQQQSVQKTAEKLALLQQQYDNIQKEMSETGTYSSDLENKLLAKKAQIDKTSEALQRETEKLEQMKAAMQAAGVDTSDLDNELEALKQQLHENEEALSDLTESGTDAFSAIGTALADAGIIAGLKAIYEATKECVDVSMEFEANMASVKRTVGGDDNFIHALGEDFKEMSTQIPITTGTLTEIATTAGQLGIAQENVKEFTTVMAMLDTTTDLTAEDAATMLAQFSNITGAKDYMRLGSTIADLGDSTATTASKIVEMSQGMAAAGNIAGLKATDILGIAAAVGSLGIESQAGSTAMATLIQNIYKAVETGDGLEGFAQVAGMSASEFRKAWGTDAAGALASFISGLNDTSRNGKSAIVILDELGITNVRQTKAILGLASAEGLLQGTIAQANSAWNANTALQAKADIMYGTTTAKLTMMQNSFANLKIAVGDAFLPVLQDVYPAITNLTKGLTEFIAQNPALVRGVAAAIAVFGGIAAAITTYVAAAKVAAVASTLLTASIPGVGPILAVAGAIAALTGAVVLLSGEMNDGAGQSEILTLASQKQYEQLQSLRDEYDATVETYGKNSEQAKLLEWRISQLNSEYEANRQTVNELVASYDAAREASEKQLTSNRESYEAMGEEDTKVFALLHRLQELASQTDQTVASQEEMKAIIKSLNGMVPELALNYEDVASGMQDVGASLEAMLQKKAAMARYEAAQGFYVDALNSEYAAQKDLNRLHEERAPLLEKEQQTYAEYQKLAGAVLEEAFSAEEGHIYDTSAADKAREDWIAARDALAGVDEQIDKAEADLEHAKKESAFYLEEMTGYVQETAEAAEDGSADVNAALDETFSQLQKLCEAYDAAYDAAYQSISGQYKLWTDQKDINEVTDKTIHSVDDMNASMTKQTQYWNDYNANLTSLAARRGDIEGLGDVIASFADGSPDSVNAIAGMAQASDADLKAMVANFQALKQAQQDASGSIAEISTDFDANLASIQASVETTIGNMNLSGEAASAAQATLQGYISGAQSMSGRVTAAFAAIGAAAAAALRAAAGGAGGGGGGKYTGADKMPAGYALVGESGPELVYFHGGEEILDANETAAVQAAGGMGEVTMAPELMALMRQTAPEPMTAEPADRGGSVSVSVQINVAGDASTETVEQLRAYGDDFKEAVLEVLEENDIDVQRRAYR